MRHRKLLAALSVGALTVVGGFAATGPDNAGPPEDRDTPEQAENGCQGINEARERLGEDNPAADVLDAVADLLSDDDCEGHDRASDRGENGDEG
jgi:hypothetical protein